MNSYERIIKMQDTAPLIRQGLVSVPPIIPTGIFSLDAKLNGGLPRQKLCVIAARTSHGKTATAVRLAINMALAGRPVNVFWLEDDEQEFDIRAIAALSREPLVSVLAKYRAGDIDSVIKRINPDDLENWKRLRTFWFERPTISEICDNIEWCEKDSVVILDHLGEVIYDIGPKHEAMGTGLRALRASARKAGVLLVCMTQLNRDWDRRKSQSDNPDRVRPVLSDIENSGQIEQVARVCIIAEKRHVKSGEEETPTGQYIYHIWKPFVSIAECRWDDKTATPDNPIATVIKPYQDTERDDEW